MVLSLVRGTSLPFYRRKSCDTLVADYRNPALPWQVPDKINLCLILGSANPSAAGPEEHSFRASPEQSRINADDLPIALTL